MTEPRIDADIGRVLADVVEEAGALILPLWRSGLKVDQKADESPVTEADRRGEALILKRLGELFPGVPVISEEDACECGAPEKIGPRFFLVDPVDGTKAFIRGDEHWTVNIGPDPGRPPRGRRRLGSGLEPHLVHHRRRRRGAARSAAARATRSTCDPGPRARRWPWSATP